LVGDGEKREVKECSTRAEGIVDSSSEWMEWRWWVTIGGEREGLSKNCEEGARKFHDLIPQDR